MSDGQNELLFTEIYVDTAEIVPIKFSLRFTFDIIMQVFFSRQFSSLRFTMPGGLPGPVGENGSETPPVREAKSAAPGRRQKAPSEDKGTQKTKKASVAPKEK